MKTDTPVITSSSFSRIEVFDKCKFQAYLKYGLKIPEPDRPLPPGKLEHANDRGTRIHTAAEEFINGKNKTGKLIRELLTFEEEFNHLRALFPQGIVHLEGEWGMTKDWEPCDWRVAWLRLKLDAIVHMSEEEAIAIDFKSGKRFGNEIKHAEQLALYQLVTFLRYPKLKVVHTELWYTDVDHLERKTYERERGLRMLRTFDSRFKRMTSATEFPPNPNRFSCQYCPYGTKKEYSTGHCSKEAS